MLLKENCSTRSFVLSLNLGHAEKSEKCGRFLIKTSHFVICIDHDNDPKQIFDTEVHVSKLRLFVCLFTFRLIRNSLALSRVENNVEADISHEDFLFIYEETLYA